MPRLAPAAGGVTYNSKPLAVARYVGLLTTTPPRSSRHASTSSRAPTQQTSQSDGHAILAAQRRNRPVSPHLGIYKPQITSVLSISERITGLIFSGGLYVFGSSYLLAHVMGWHFDSSTLVSAFAAWPVAAQVSAKMAVAFPFVFHCWNGVRHAVWDAGYMMKNQQVNISGWITVGLSVVTSVGLVMW